MKRVTKLTSIAISLILALAMLAGCTAATPTANATVAPTEAGTSASAAGSSAPAATETPSWLADTTPRTVDWYVATSDYNKTWDPNVSWAAKYLKDKIGITINFSFPVGGDQDEKLNTMIASDSLPDLLAVGENGQQYPMLEQANKLQPLNKLMDASAPAFKALLPKEMVDWCTYTDGNLYGIPSHFTAMSEITPDSGYNLLTNTGIVARKDIMDKLGIVADDFKTTDGTIKALEKVRDANITYNGKKVIPFYVGYDVEDDVNWYVSQMFGINKENPDGTYANVYHNPKYLEMLQFLSKCYNDGLMDQENFTGTYDTQTEKLSSGQIFCMAGCLGDWGDGLTALNRADKNAISVNVGPINASGSDPLYVSSGSMTGWLMTVIPVTTDKPERVLALMNYLYSEEGRYLTTVGVEGQTFTLQNGKAVLNPDIQAEFTADNDKATVKWGFSGKTNNEGVMWMMYDRVWGKIHAPAPTDPTDIYWQGLLDGAAKNVVSSAPFEACNPDPGTPEADIKAQVDNLYPAEITKIILCKTPDEVTAAWNAFVAKVDSLGYDKVISAINVKFQAHKKALGLDYAWPTNKK